MISNLGAPAGVSEIHTVTFSGTVEVGLTQSRKAA